MFTFFLFAAIACQTITFNPESIDSSSFFKGANANGMQVSFDFEPGVEYSFHSKITSPEPEDPEAEKPWLVYFILDVNKFHGLLDIERVDIGKPQFGYGFTIIPAKEKDTPKIYIQGTANGTLTVCKAKASSGWFWF